MPSRKMKFTALNLVTFTLSFRQGMGSQGSEGWEGTFGCAAPHLQSGLRCRLLLPQLQTKVRWGWGSWTCTSKVSFAPVQYSMLQYCHNPKVGFASLGQLEACWSALYLVWYIFVSLYICIFVYLYICVFVYLCTVCFFYTGPPPKSSKYKQINLD